MRILSRYVFREIVSSALIGTALATGVIFLQRVGKIFELLVRSSPDPEAIIYLFALAIPPVLPLTIPFGVLVGILVGLGRMSADGEITAMRAAGVSSRKVVAPVMCVALLAAAIAGAASLRLTPLSIRETYRVINVLGAGQLTAQIQPRVFDESFPNMILYVGDVRTGPVTVWRNIFLADVTPPEGRKAGLREKAQGPRVTVAREAIAVAYPAQNRVQLSLRDGSTHEMGKDANAYDAEFPKGEQVLDASPPAEKRARPFDEMNTREVWRHSRGGPDWLDARIELHRRFALPVACLMLALVGIPLGISSRRGGRSSGYVTAVFLAFFCYYLAFISLLGLARQQALRVEIAVWLPNAVFGLAGIVLLTRMESPGERDLIGGLIRMVASWYAAAKPRLRNGREADRAYRLRRRLLLLPQIIDTYVLWNFLFYFVLLLSSFVSMTLIYNFFELLSDIVKNKIPLSKVFTFLAFLSPQLIYTTLPISVLVAVLVTFGVFTKHNEVTAFKACGVSLHRLCLPILLMSGLLSAGLFAFNHYYVPEANRRQDALRNEIKGRPAQTYLRPDRKWIKGIGSAKTSWIYYYRY